MTSQIITSVYDSANDSLYMNPENCETLTKAVEHFEEYAKGLCEDALEENKELNFDKCLRQCYKALTNHLDSDDEFKNEITSISKLEEFVGSDILGNYDFNRDLKCDNEVAVSVKLNENNELNFIFDIVEDKDFDSTLELKEVDLI
ncbi:hypothetical protein [Riemerella columbina]|uniref:hypothetical protein n=1 Tax=Riemerella columbina TaxID=103810 RepID=UPI0003677D6D|nr:hypothetical protein [Riemerella columbina]